MACETAAITELHISDCQISTSLSVAFALVVRQQICRDASQEETWRGGGTRGRGEGSAGKGARDQLFEVEARSVGAFLCPCSDDEHVTAAVLSAGSSPLVGYTGTKNSPTLFASKIISLLRSSRNNRTSSKILTTSSSMSSKRARCPSQPYRLSSRTPKKQWRRTKLALRYS
jgi:hypothetical protein